MGEFVDLTAPGILGGYKAAGQADEPSRNYTYSCTDDRFEEVMVYYHVDTVQRKIQSLGYSGQSGIIERPIPAHAHYFDSCNAFYDPASRGIHFGDGDSGSCTMKADAAEDADVIVHEYGHAIQDDQVPAWGFGSADQAEQAWAMGEGFSDFLTGAVFGDPCLGEWFSFGLSCLRTLANSSQYPADFEACRPTPPQPAQPHCAGLIWGGALWDLVQALGGDQNARDLALTLVLESHFFLDPLSTFAEAAAAIRQVDSLLYDGTHVATIDSVFSVRGISSLGSVSGFPYAYLRIRHTFPDDLDLQLLVGSTSSPVCIQNVWDPNFTPPFSSPDLVDYEDLSTSACNSFLPPTPAQPWYLEVRDAFAGLTGTLEEFEIVLPGPQRCIATDLPIAIPDDDGFVYSAVDCTTVVGPFPAPDLDGDRYPAVEELRIGTDPYNSCGVASPDPVPPSPAWPSDLFGGAGSANLVNIQDVTVFVTINGWDIATGVPDTDVSYEERFNLFDAGPSASRINLQDITALVTGDRDKPSMLFGAKAFNGPECPWS